jgi:shikimate dehydrogenase
LVVDLAYGDGDTALMQIAKARGARAVDGLEVLVHQGAASLRIWTGEEPPIEAMRGATRVS